MINEIRINSNELSLLLEYESNIRPFQSIDILTGRQVLILRNLSDEDLIKLGEAIEVALLNK